MTNRESAQLLAAPVSTAAGEPPARRLAFVDALRGFAFLMVLAVHCRHEVTEMPGRYRSLLQQGSRGVQLFFIVSALTLFHSFAHRTAREHLPISNFFLRRFFRIAPLYWLAAVFYILLEGLAPNYWGPEGKSLLDVFLNFIFLHSWKIHAISSVVPGGWSIGTEMSFYLVVPLLFRSIRGIWGALWLSLAALVVGTLLSQGFWVALQPRYAPELGYLLEGFFSAWFPAQLHVFASGLVLYFILQNEPQAAKGAGRWRAWWLLAAAAYLCFAAAYNRFGLLPVTVPYSVAFVLLAWSLFLQPLRLLVNAATCFLGRVSYSCYINHFLVIGLIVRQEQAHRLGWLPGQSSPLARWGVLYLFTLAGTLLLSTVTYRWIEEPCIRFGRRLIARREQRYAERALPMVGTG